MTGDQPCEHEDTESDIATHFVFEVFEDFGSLHASVPFFSLKRNYSTYRQQKVDNVHQAQHHIRNIIETVDVSRTQQRAGNQMMGQHLVVILPLLLYVDDKNLLQPERQLHKQIPLQGPRHIPIRPFSPDGGKIEPVV